MLTRRSFLQIVAGAVAGISQLANSTAGPVRFIDPEASKPFEPARKEDGIEVLEGTQGHDADYWEIRVVKWKDDRIVNGRSHRWTANIRRMNYQASRKLIESRVREMIQELQSC